MQTFTVTLTPGTTTWTVPDGATLRRVQCWGAGGSGGVVANQTATQRIATGGGAGGYGELNTSASLSSFTPGTIITVAIGAKGAATTRTTGGVSAGHAGGDTYFNGVSYAAAPVGGQGGGAGTAQVTTGAVISGGAAGAGKGDFSASGGRGGNGQATGTSGAIMTGGGGSGGPDGAGSNGADATVNSTIESDGGNADNGNVIGGSGNGVAGGSTVDLGGAGGSGGLSNANPGGNGGDYGGGGGGALWTSVGTTSGAGGDGKIKITYTLGGQIFRAFIRGQ